MKRRNGGDAGWPDDPVVAEVRAIRAQLLREGGGTIRGLIELVRREAALERQADARPSKRRGAVRTGNRRGQKT